MKRILYILLLLSLSSCEIELEDMYLTRNNYISDKLRIDGYYYDKEPNSDRVALGYFFYQNGVSYDSNNDYLDSFNEIEESIKNYNEVYKKYAYGWGVFIVKDSTILIEQYVQSALNKKLTAIFSGEILNDTTFTLNERYKLDQNGDKYDVYEFDVTYHFRQYSSKPDSTNNYIK
ncbi:MAG: hypothetical protein M0P23_08530 [Bacteroidales bacterium]|nr:hypothetical protein [Bacteroidales bacterium]